ncbi:hypothetical protein MTO96_038038 [Rhipicephalus appendiculatus]
METELQCILKALQRFDILISRSSAFPTSTAGCGQALGQPMCENAETAEKKIVNAGAATDAENVSDEAAPRDKT